MLTQEQEVARQEEMEYIRQSIELDEADGVFVTVFNSISDLCARTATANGFSNNRTVGEDIALMHSELSEMLEAFRSNGPSVSEKIAPFTEAEDEAADVIIRLMHFGRTHGLDIAGALLAKARYNTTRPYLHGKKF